jgi:hypothetical protein
MGSTFFGDAVGAAVARLATPPQLKIDRGMDGRASGCA